MARSNLSIHLAERPKGDVIPGQTFTQKTTPAPTPDDLKDGQILVEVLYLSLDPSLRAHLNVRRSYAAPVEVGAVMRGLSVSRVLASKSATAPVGSLVSGVTGWTEYAILSEGTFEPASAYPGLKEPQDMLSALGLTGLTAWYGMTEIANVKAGELVVVSGAAGATGSIAAQIAKIKGARVVGICGSDDKCAWLTKELGIDVALNYKAEDFKQKFKEATDKYIDVYYDNVGGEILDLALGRAQQNARFVECGLISQYNGGVPKPLLNLSNIVTMRIRMQGFIIMDHPDKFPKARADLSAWLAQGKIKKSETIIKGGLKAAEQALVDMFRGVNTGKLLVEVKNPSETPPKL